MTAPDTIASAGRALRDGSLTAAGLAERVLARTHMAEAQIHAYLTLDSEGMRAAAAAADEELAQGRDRGPLHGIPIAVKDNMCTLGLETTAGSKMLAGYVPPYEATAVRRLREAGALVTGKTNLDEFAMGSSTENSAFGPTRNPWRTDRVPGGSSGGSAAAVAAGMALGALGSDTGGSIRQPAALCGLVGVKPTYGRVSRYGLIAFASSLDQIGPFARTVSDAACLLDAVSGRDPLDATSYPEEIDSAAAHLGRGLEGLRVGVVDMRGGAGVEPAVTEAFTRVAEAMEGAGAQLSEAELPSVDAALSAYYLIAPAECSANLARFDGVRYGLRAEGRNTAEMMSRTRAEGFGPEVIRRILLGTFALSAGYHDAFYGQAQRVRTLLRQDFDRAYQRCDVLISPTSPTSAFPIGSRTADPMTMYMSDVMTVASNLAGHPAVNVPVGLDPDGLPIGFQIMAPAMGEAVMLQAAEAVEAQAGFRPAAPFHPERGFPGGEL